VGLLLVRCISLTHTVSVPLQTHVYTPQLLISVGDISVEGFTCLLVFKNVFSFALTFKGFDWLIQARTTKHMFVALGSVQVAVCALTIPLCEFLMPLAGEL
jgi:hypothetical protein